MIRTHLKASGLVLAVAALGAACVAYPPTMLILLGLLFTSIVYGIAYLIVSPDDGSPGW